MRFLSRTAICFFFNAVAFPQSDRSTIAGTVLDPASAAVPGAPVIARRSQTGLLYETATTVNYATPIKQDVGDLPRPSQTSGPYSTRPDYIGGDPIRQDYRGTLVYLNRAAFAPVPISPVSGATIRTGNVGNNALRGPGAVRIDHTIGKSFQISERLRLQLRGDLFNALNHTNYNNPSSNVGSSTFRQDHGHGGSADDAGERETDCLIGTSQAAPPAAADALPRDRTWLIGEQ